MTFKKRLRVRHIQVFVFILCSTIVVFTIILGSGAQTVSYLNSERPGTRTDHVKVGETGEIDFKGRNRSLIPVLVYIEGPVDGTAHLVSPLSDFETTVEVSARHEPGWHEISINQYTYPVAMPPNIIDFFYQLSPYIAMIAVMAVIIALIYLILRIMEPWIPLSLLGGKHLTRNYRRFKRSLMP